MIKVIIDGDKAIIDTEGKTTNGATKDELRTLLNIAEQLCGDCKEGAE